MPIVIARRVDPAARVLRLRRGDVLRLPWSSSPTVLAVTGKAGVAVPAGLELVAFVVDVNGVVLSDAAIAFYNQRLADRGTAEIIEDAEAGSRLQALAWFAAWSDDAGRALHRVDIAASGSSGAAADDGGLPEVAAARALMAVSDPTRLAADTMILLYLVADPTSSLPAPDSVDLTLLLGGRTGERGYHHDVRWEGSTLLLGELLSGLQGMQWVTRLDPVGRDLEALCIHHGLEVVA